MLGFVSRLFDPGGFVPRWKCGDFPSTLGWIHIVSDFLTFAAYYAVPLIVTLHVLKRRDIAYRGVLLFFVALVFLSCGTVHLVEAGIFWWPVYRLSGALKLLTALASCGMVAVLIVLVPKALGIRQMAMLAGDLEQENRDRRRVEEELRTAHSRLEAILNSTADAIVSLGSDLTIISFNASAERLFGYSASEIIGQSFSRLVPDLDSGSVSRDEVEMAGRHASGAELSLALRLATVLFAEERQFIATVQDISVRQEAERQRDRMFEAIRETVQHLSTSSEKISKTVAQQSKAAEEQAKTISTNVAAVQHATETADESTRLANEVAKMARRAEVIGQIGRKAIEETQVVMNSVREQVESTATNILALAERAQTIGNIITAVNEIAEQTNVLALNAAIEASRAGEAGKGFAVVATEVKSLAEQAKDSTHEVRGILSEIQQATNDAVMSTEQGTKSVIESNEVVAKAAETIEQLGVMVGEGALAASRIVAASTEQAEVMNQITRTMSQIDQMAKENVDANRETAGSAKDLFDLGNRLHALFES